MWTTEKSRLHEKIVFFWNNLSSRHAYSASIDIWFNFKRSLRRIAKSIITRNLVSFMWLDRYLFEISIASNLQIHHWNELTYHYLMSFDCKGIVNASSSFNPSKYQFFAFTPSFATMLVNAIDILSNVIPIANIF